jgi:hypothetical protein
MRPLGLRRPAIRLPQTALREPVHHADDRRRTRAPRHSVTSYALAERADTAGASGEPLPAAMRPYRARKSVRFLSAHQAPSFREPYRATGEISFASRYLRSRGRWVVTALGAISSCGNRLLAALASRCIRMHAALEQATSSGPISTARLHALPAGHCVQGDPRRVLARFPVHMQGVRRGCMLPGSQGFSLGRCRVWWNKHRCRQVRPVPGCRRAYR